MKIRLRSKSTLRKRAKHGFRGYPAATVAFYGPSEARASKVAVGIVESAGGEPILLERWFSDTDDVRRDPAIEAAILGFLEAHGVVSVAMTDGLLGCPHEEGVEYPEGASCPQCPYWGRA